MAAHRASRFDEAAGWLKQAIALAPGQPAFHYLLGMVYQDKNDLSAAVGAYRDSVRLAPGLSQAWNNLGLLLYELDQPEAAVAALARAVALKPDSVRAARNLASVLLDLGRAIEAGRVLDQVLASVPDDVDAWLDRGEIHERMGQHALAETYYRDALRRPSPGSRAYLLLARRLKANAELREAIALLNEAHGRLSDDMAIVSFLAELHAAANEDDRARHWHALACRQSPERLLDCLRARLTLPRVFQSQAHLDASRAAFEVGLNALSGQSEVFAAMPPEAILAGVRNTNFYFAYQGGDDRAMQTCYGDFIASLLRQALPAFFVPRTASPAAGRRLRVGFVSRYFYRCTVGSYFSSWVTALDPEGFERHVFYLGDEEDDVTAELRSAATQFVSLSGDLPHMAARIAEADVDVLVYPAVGMDDMTGLLAALRLAPVQCAAWGHPVTTGLANVDYFLSCVEMEPEGAQRHYREPLLTLPGLGTCYRMPVPPSYATRADFGLPEGRVLFLFPHSLFKIHPDNDGLLARILARCPEARLVIFDDPVFEIREALLARWRPVFAEHGVDLAESVRVLPRQTRERFLAINRVCDVMLDSMHWSGGNTTLDALACGLPVLTLPGLFMRGRQSAAMLRSCGLDALVAEDSAAYVKLAVRLAEDADWRTTLRDKTINGRARLFDRIEPIRVLEARLREAHARALG